VWGNFARGPQANPGVGTPGEDIAGILDAAEITDIFGEALY
jgi:hypothetical protein